jgi:hypothetical protein
MVLKDVADPVELEKIMKYKVKKKPTINRKKARRATIPILLNDSLNFERWCTLPSMKNDIPADIEENKPNVEPRGPSIFSVL